MADDYWSDSPYAGDWSAGAFAPPGVIWLGDIPLDRARELVATGDWTVIGAPLPPLPAPTIAAPPPTTPAPEPTGSGEIPDMPWPQPTEPGGAGVDIEPGVETPPDYPLDTPTARPVGPVNPVDVSGGPEGSGGSFGIGAPPPLGGASFPPMRPMPRDTRGPRRGSPASGGYSIDDYRRQVERAQRDTIYRQRRPPPAPQIFEGEIIGPPDIAPAPPRVPRIPRPSGPLPGIGLPAPPPPRDRVSWRNRRARVPYSSPRGDKVARRRRVPAATLARAQRDYDWDVVRNAALFWAHDWDGADDAYANEIRESLARVESFFDRCRGSPPGLDTSADTSGSDEPTQGD